jgi:hypothetical protein
METRKVVRDEVAEIKVMVTRQQELLARLERAGRKHEARKERDALYRWLKQTRPAQG